MSIRANQFKNKKSENKKIRKKSRGDNKINRQKDGKEEKIQINSIGITKLIIESC